MFLIHRLLILISFFVPLYSCLQEKTSSSKDFLIPVLFGNFTNENHYVNSATTDFSIISTSISNDATSVDILPTVNANFSSSLESKSIITTSILGECSGTLHFGQEGLSSCLPLDIIFDTSTSNVLSLKPKQSLLYGRTYELYFTNQIKDTSGNFLKLEKRIKFKTRETNSTNATYSLNTTNIKPGINSPLTFSVFPNSNSKSVRSVTVIFSATVGPRPKYDGLTDFSVDYFTEKPGVMRYFSLNPAKFSPSLFESTTYQPGMSWGFGISTVFQDGSRDSVTMNVPVIKNLPDVEGTIYTIQLMGFTEDWMPTSNEFQNVGSWKIWLRVRYPDSGIVFETQRQSLDFSSHVLIRPPFGQTREEITLYFDSDGDGIPNYQKLLPSSISFSEGIYGDLSQFYIFFGDVNNGTMNLVIEE